MQTRSSLTHQERGCDSKLLETMVKMAPKRIVYVSCDPATLARDLKVLSEQGYEVEKSLQPSTNLVIAHM